MSPTTRSQSPKNPKDPLLEIESDDNANMSASCQVNAKQSSGNDTDQSQLFIDVFVNVTSPHTIESSPITTSISSPLSEPANPTCNTVHTSNDSNIVTDTTTLDDQYNQLLQSSFNVMSFIPFHAHQQWISRVRSVMTKYITAHESNNTHNKAAALYDILVLPSQTLRQCKINQI